MIGFKLSNLKKIRIILSIIFFLLISMLFLDPRNGIPAWISNTITSLQLIPSIAKLFTYIGWTAIGLIIVSILTIFFGRVYCSTICPLGTFQDIFIHINKKIHKRKRYVFTKPGYVFHYALFIFISILAIFGSLTLLNLLEPFSNYGRIVTSLFEPIVTMLNNFAASIMMRFNYYFLYTIPLRNVDLDKLIYPIIFLLFLGYLSYKRGRIFCNLLCPAGALLGLISRFSIYKIIVNKNSCNNCGACERMCKANCIDSEKQKIEFAACIGCFNCISACPTGGVIYTHNIQKISISRKERFNFSRRNFLNGIITPIVSMTVSQIAALDSTVTKTSGYFESKRNPISPPGSQSIDRYTNLCTACHLCVSACPAQVLYPSLFQYGVVGIFQPLMNYSASYCNYECTVCGEICPTGAIIPLSPEQKKLVQIGKANFFRDDCVVVANKKDCAACSEHCPTKAVYMVPYEGKLKIPELNNDICVGCGACEHACPTTPRKAIYVTSNHVHLQAKKPQVKKQENILEDSKEFPF